MNVSRLVRFSTWQERFWSKVNRRADDECWPWNGTHDSYGYGVFAATPRLSKKAHRVAFELLRGPLDSTLTIDHLCQVKDCVNPNHMEEVSSSLNAYRANRSFLCQNGHVFTPESAYVKRNGTRMCRICHAAWMRRYRAIHGRTA